MVRLEAVQGINTLKAMMFAAIVSIAIFPSRAFAQELRPITFIYVPSVMDSVVPLFGDKIGIFAKHKIKVNTITAANGPAEVAALASGSADITHTGPTVLFPAMNTGADIQILMNNFEPEYELIAQPDLALPHLKDGYPAVIQDLKGKRIGVVGRGGLVETYARLVLKADGLNPDSDVAYISVGTGASAIAAFRNKIVDAMVALTPNEQILGESAFQRIVDLPTTQKKVFGDNFLFLVFSANGAFVKKNPELAQDFCRAAVETVQYIRNPSNRAAVSSFLSGFMGINEAQANEVYDKFRNNYNNAMNRTRWDSMKEFYAQLPDWNQRVYEPCVTIGNNGMKQ